jgi:hypothetical protein
MVSWSARRFLGFVHYCGTIPKGRFMVWRETANQRMVAAEAD